MPRRELRAELVAALVRGAAGARPEGLARAAAACRSGSRRACARCRSAMPTTPERSIPSPSCCPWANSGERQQDDEGEGARDEEGDAVDESSCAAHSNAGCLGSAAVGHDGGRRPGIDRAPGPGRGRRRPPRPARARRAARAPRWTVLAVGLRRAAREQEGEHDATRRRTPRRARSRTRRPSSSAMSGHIATSAPRMRMPAPSQMNEISVVHVDLERSDLRLRVRPSR